MKKRVKNGCKVRRYYASGIPMQREKNNLVDIPAGKMVGVIKVMTSKAICQFGDLVVAIPNDNFMGDKISKAKAVKGEKVPAKKKTVKKVKAVAAEPEVQTVETAPVVDTAPPAEAPQAVETPVVETQTETAPAPVVEQPVAEVAAV